MAAAWTGVVPADAADAGEIKPNDPSGQTELELVFNVGGKKDEVGKFTATFQDLADYTS